MTAGTALMVWAAECPAPLGWPEAFATVGSILAAALIVWALVKYL